MICGIPSAISSSNRSSNVATHLLQAGCPGPGCLPRQTYRRTRFRSVREPGLRTHERQSCPADASSTVSSSAATSQPVPAAHRGSEGPSQQQSMRHHSVVPDAAMRKAQPPPIYADQAPTPHTSVRSGTSQPRSALHAVRMLRSTAHAQVNRRAVSVQPQITRPCSALHGVRMLRNTAHGQAPVQLQAAAAAVQTAPPPVALVDAAHSDHAETPPVNGRWGLQAWASAAQETAAANSASLWSPSRCVAGCVLTACLPTKLTQRQQLDFGVG